MPRADQKTITFTKKVFMVAKEKADKQGKSVAGFVSELILDYCMERTESLRSS